MRRASTDVEDPRRDLGEMALEEFLGPLELDPRAAACEPLELHPSLVMAEDLGVHGVSSLGGSWSGRTSEMMGPWNP